MSDSILTIIPCDPAWVPSSDLADLALRVYQRHVPAADEVKAEFSDGIQFVDQGSNFESVSCPQCGALLDEGWWSEQMDAAWSLSQFADLNVVTPCCQAGSSLNDLAYPWPAGFCQLQAPGTEPFVRRQ